MAGNDHSQVLQAQVQEALQHSQPLVIRGRGSKAFYGRAVQGTGLEVSAHRGILEYDPCELVITARAGTPLAELESALAAEGQMLAFEPPRFGDGGSIGGVVACGLSGPRRPWSGAVRDFLLGARVLTGRGENLAFGGQVMKNVAGYDSFRLMSGALGTLGVLLEVSLKVLPRAEQEMSLVQEVDTDTAIQRVNEWSAQPVPLTAASIENGLLRVRIEGSDATLRHMAQQLGGEPADTAYWQQLRDQQLDFFRREGDLWRISLPPTTPGLDLPGEWLLDWGGAQRWWRGSMDTGLLRRRAAESGGHATQFRGANRDGEVFQPLPGAMLDLHRRLKNAFDPQGILNPGRMYEGL